MLNIQQLTETRAHKLAEARALTDDGHLDDNKQARFDTLETEIRDIDAKITRAKKIAELEKQAPASTIGAKDSLETEIRNTSLAKFIQLGMGTTETDLGREREISRELQKRAGGASQGGVFVPMEVFEKRVTVATGVSPVDGGHLVGTDHRGDLYVDLLRAKLITGKLGATVLSGLTGNVEIPAGKTAATSNWIAENSALTPSDAGYRKITMSPKHVGALTEYSRNMILQASPDVETLIRNDFASVLAEAIDRVAIDGGGANEPSGILSTSGVSSSSMTIPTYADILAMIETLEIDNVDVTNAGFAVHPSIVRKLRSTLKAGTDAAIGYIMTDANTLAGYKLVSSTLIPAGGSPATATMLLGNWSDLLIGYWNSFEILVNPYETTAYSKGNVQIRALLTADVAVRHAESFLKAESVLV